MHPDPSREEFFELVKCAREQHSGGRVLVPLGVRLLGDQLTPALAYRRLVAGDARTDPSFLLESVEGGERIGRYSLMGARPALQVIAQEHEVTIRTRDAHEERFHSEDPLDLLRELSRQRRLIRPVDARRSRLPGSPWGGWFGYAGYDTVRYAEPGKLPFGSAPPDDRKLPDLDFGFYDEIVVFDHVETLVHVVRLVEVGGADDPGALYDESADAVEVTAKMLQEHSKPLAAGEFDGADESIDWSRVSSNLSADDHAKMVAQAQQYIRAGDIFQVVLGQRFLARSAADPFDVYRALRALNPSPYMGYLQCAGCMLVASSPEILCRVERREDDQVLVVTNRPLAGTRKRGETTREDLELEQSLLSDEKERAEHVMLVDLGRNDVGRVSREGSVALQGVMEVERYSHVMHLSSTVTGELRDGLGAWDALRAALPVGTISGAPKVRAMQIIDELEPVRRGPYGGGFGYVGLGDEMDIALALRTIVVPTALWDGREWTYHLQAAGGIVADSQAPAEFEETVNKASALVRAIEVAERAFGNRHD